MLVADGLGETEGRPRGNGKIPGPPSARAAYFARASSFGVTPRRLRVVFSESGPGACFDPDFDFDADDADRDGKCVGLLLFDAAD